MSQKLSSAAQTGKYSIGVLGKAFDLLDLLDGNEPLTLTELSHRSGMNKATTLRILSNLEGRRYVERNEAGRYSLGVRLLQLGNRKSAGLDLRTIARPVLVALHSAFGETVNLAVPGERGIVYIDILESPFGLRMAASVGSSDDFHSTAIGKAIAAQWSEERTQEMLGKGVLGSKTPQTIIEPGDLVRELTLVRARGFATDNEENEAGARCVGAPVFDHTGACVGAISISGPASRMSEERMSHIAVRVVDAARDISSRLGYLPKITTPARKDLETIS
jgi:IclR family KDG regulon transcriptional repressor